jgi:hypothetical protein
VTAHGNSRRLLLILGVVYCLASLAHFVHNAEFLSDYPNMPASLTRSKIYLAWLAITAIGALGLIVARSRLAVAGFVLVAIYAMFGLDGLGHYVLAPMSAHSLTMNLTIWCEVAAAAALLVSAMYCVFAAGRQFGAERVGA